MPEARSKIFSDFYPKVISKTFNVGNKPSHSQARKGRRCEGKGAFTFSVFCFRGSGGMLPQKSLKIRCSEMLFPAISVIS